MEEIKKRLINNKIIKIIKIHDYWQLYTRNLIIIINNYFEIDSIGKVYSDNTDEYDIKGLLLNNCIELVDYEDSKHFSLIFDNKVILKIFLEDKYYSTPEAIEIYDVDDNWWFIL